MQIQLYLYTKWICQQNESLMPTNYFFPPIFLSILVTTNSYPSGIWCNPITRQTNQRRWRLSHASSGAHETSQLHFFNCCSCNVRGQQNTHGGKCYLPLSHPGAYKHPWLASATLIARGLDFQPQMAVLKCPECAFSKNSLLACMIRIKRLHVQGYFGNRLW